jgi:gephyrin
MVEDTVLKSMTEDGKEKEVEILTDKIELDENIREIGSDIKAGEVILREGEEITAVVNLVCLLR